MKSSTRGLYSKRAPKSRFDTISRSCDGEIMGHMSNNQEFVLCVGNASNKDFSRLLGEVRTNVEG